MRIHLLTAAGPWSGVEVHTVGLADTLLARGHDVAIVELGRRGYWSEQHRRGNIEVIYLPLDERDSPNVPLDEVGCLRWWRLLKGLGGDVGVLVKGHFGVGGWRLDLVARLCFRMYATIEHMNTPLPQRSQGFHWEGTFPSLGLWWYRAALNGWVRSLAPSLVIGVSDAVTSTLATDYHFPARKTVTAHNGVDPSRFQPNMATRRAVRDSLGISYDAFVFGAVGRLSAMKNHKAVVELLPRLLVRVPGRDIRLVLVGDGPLRAELERTARAHGVQERVVFTGFSERPMDMYAAFDIFVMPSLNEGLALTLLEAMACQCVPVATSVGGLPEVLTRPELGWLIRPGDQDAFFNAMAAAATMTGDALDRMGRHARQHVMTHFNAAVQFKKIAELLERT